MVLILYYFKITFKIYFNIEMVFSNFARNYYKNCLYKTSSKSDVWRPLNCVFHNVFYSYKYCS